MEIIEAIVLGLVQGLTEFLPVSSTGHLELTKKIFEIKLSGSGNIAFDIVAHAGSAIAILFFFIREFIIKNSLPQSKNVESKSGKNFIENIKKTFSIKFISNVVVASIPAVLVYLLMKDYLNVVFESSLVVAICLLVTGFFLIFLDFIKEKSRNFDEGISYTGKNDSNHEEPTELLPFVNAKDVSIMKCWFVSFFIGIFQAIAILPGISRSGFTIGGGLIMKLKREHAVRFSFILGFVAILGGVFLELKNISNLSVEISSEVLLITFAASFISSMFALQLILWVVRVRRIKYFGFYCFIVSILSFIFIV